MNPSAKARIEGDLARLGCFAGVFVLDVAERANGEVVGYQFDPVESKASGLEGARAWYSRFGMRPACRDLVPSGQELADVRVDRFIADVSGQGTVLDATRFAQEDLGDNVVRFDLLHKAPASALAG